MEPATYRDIWKNFLSNPKREVIAARLRNMAGTFIADNNSIPKPEAMANYHKRYYNTAAGKAIANENISRFYQAIKA